MLNLADKMPVTSVAIIITIKMERTVKINLILMVFIWTSVYFPTTYPFAAKSFG